MDLDCGTLSRLQTAKPSRNDPHRWLLIRSFLFTRNESHLEAETIASYVNRDKETPASSQFSALNSDRTGFAIQQYLIAIKFLKQIFRRLFWNDGPQRASHIKKDYKTK